MVVPRCGSKSVLVRRLASNKAKSAESRRVLMSAPLSPGTEETKSILQQLRPTTGDPLPPCVHSLDAGVSLEFNRKLFLENVLSAGKGTSV